MRANVMNSNKKSKKNFKSFVMSEIMCIFAAIFCHAKFSVATILFNN